MTRVTVKFARGRLELYNLFSPELKQSIVYFAEDTNEIYVRDVAYGINLSSETIDLISKVEATAIGTLKFTCTNGKTTTISIPEATNLTAGLLSAVDKAIIDDIPNVYATKEELRALTSRIYRFRGVKLFFTDLPTEGMEDGDVYNILNEFDLDGKHYNPETNVAWDGEHWDPLGGTSQSYTKEEADEKFVPWTVDGNTKTIVLPKNSKILATKVNDELINLINLKPYGEGETEVVELGTNDHALNINSSSRPSVNGEELIAYLSDTGYIDMSKYGTTYSISYIPELTQNYIDALDSIGDNLDNYPITSVNSPLVGKDYLVIFYTDDLAATHIDWFTPSGILPNATYAAIKGLREEYLDMFSWLDLNDGSDIPTPELRTNTLNIKDALINGDTEVTELNGTTRDIIIPEEARAGATVTVNLAENSTLTTSKRVTLVNNSETPANLTINTPAGTNITVTLKGLYDIVVTSVSVTIKDGTANQVVIPETATNAITVNTQIVNSLTVSSSSSANLTISGNTNADGDLIIAAPNASVTLNGTYDKVTSTTADNTLTIGASAYMDKLVVMKGNVIVNDINIANRIGRVINNTEYTVECKASTVSDWSTFRTSAMKPGITTIDEDIESTAGITFGILASGNYRWNLNNHNLTCGNSSSGCFLIRGGANVEIYGPGSVTNNAQSYGLWVSGATANIYGGDWKAYTHVLYCEKGEINIYDGTFECLSEDKKFTLNCLDANYTNGTAKITIYGGKFYGWNPAASMGEPGGPVSFLADGYSVVEVEDGVYQVVHI